MLTVDDIRSLAARLEKHSAQQLLRCLRELPKRPRLTFWDDPPARVVKMTIAMMGRRWELRDDDRKGWTIRPLQPQRSVSASSGISPRDALLIYGATRRRLAIGKKRLGARRSTRRRAYTQLKARDLLRQLVEWPADQGDAGPLDVNDDLMLTVSLGKRSVLTTLDFAHFAAGEFAPSDLAKQIVAAQLESSVPTLIRVLAKARRQYRAKMQAKPSGAHAMIK